jgi:hypothetical protein
MASTGTRIVSHDSEEVKPGSDSLAPPSPQQRTIGTVATALAQVLSPDDRAKLAAILLAGGQ